MCVLMFQTAQALEDFYSTDLSNWRFAKPGEEVTLQASQNSVTVRVGPLGGEVLVPLAGN
jgi:hypothetical protein